MLCLLPLSPLPVLVMDVRKMDAFLKGSFDVIIDKGEPHTRPTDASGRCISRPHCWHCISVTGTLDCLFASYNFVKDVQMGLRVGPPRRS